MKNNIKNNNQNNAAVTIKWIVAIVLIFALLSSVVMIGLKFSGVLDKQEDPSLNGGGGMVVDPDDPNANMMKLSVSPKFVASSAEDSKTKVLTATVEPANAPQEVDWAIAFVNPASEWATGKTVTDYVRVTPESDGAKTATVTCLQAFGEQIKVTVSARSDTSKNATCTVDYVKNMTASFNPKIPSYPDLAKPGHNSSIFININSSQIGTIEINKMSVSIDAEKFLKAVFGEANDCSWVDEYCRQTVGQSDILSRFAITWIMDFYIGKKSDTEAVAYCTSSTFWPADGESWWNAMNYLYGFNHVKNSQLKNDIDSINTYINNFNKINADDRYITISFTYETAQQYSYTQQIKIQIEPRQVSQYAAPVSDVTVDPGDVYFS